ncbi:winged helix-turn-helix transcriptional regulator [Nocardia sp. NPDC051052]|uniref:winged helix-turn-helix transcriptional regulator n=1 Tax=Nocardia sp. NPDC051052 TaxID=3364322 RepID=UPI0037AEB838
MPSEHEDNQVDAAVVERETLTPEVARDLLNSLAGKWAALVVRRLDERPHRFAELRRSIDGISQRMLSVTLRGLERDGIVERTVHTTVPPQVEYALTDLGRTLEQVVNPLLIWMHSHLGEVEPNRARYDSRTTAQ